jgi:hypothetical protein
MAIRKQYGGPGHDLTFFYRYKWWIGVMVDAVGGCLFWPAMPFIPAEIISPTVCAIQLATSYLLGLAVFKERCDVWRNVGLLAAASGIACMIVSTSEPATRLPTDALWLAWTSLRFLATNLIVLIILTASFFIAGRPVFCALVCAYFDGIQFIASKIIADALFEGANMLQKETVAAAFIKVLCIIVVITSQQCGFRADLSRFSGIYLVSSTVSMVVFGSAFFGEPIEVTPYIVLGALFTLAGIWILSLDADTDDSSISQTEKEKEIIGKDHDTMIAADS